MIIFLKLFMSNNPSYSLKYSFLSHSQYYPRLNFIKNYQSKTVVWKKSMIDKLPTNMKLMQLTPTQKFGSAGIISFWMLIEFL